MPGIIIWLAGPGWSNIGAGKRLFSTPQDLNDGFCTNLFFYRALKKKTEAIFFFQILVKKKQLKQITYLL